MQALKKLFYAVGARLSDALFRYMAGTGLVATLGPVPTANDFASARVTNPNQSEVVRQRLYDWLLYPAAGQNQLNFFQQPIGQGVTTAIGAVVGSPKTYADTVMTLGGQLPSGATYMVQTVEVHFFPGLSAAANTYTPATISIFAAVAAAAVVASLNDVNSFYQSGWLEFNILQKNYIREAPLMTFPPSVSLSANVALSSNSATTSEVALAFARADGMQYQIPGGILLQPAVNFVVSLNFPTAVALPSGFNGRAGIVLDGWMARASQ